MYHDRSNQIRFRFLTSISVVLFFAVVITAQQPKAEPTPNIAKPSAAKKKTPGFWDTRKGYFEWTGRGRSFSGNHPGKIEETRDIGDGPTIRRVKLSFGSRETPYM